ncbi:MAG TPA: radical SAM protein [Anaerolineales bacterium]|nr:radical SAM protein [Anaerolineales bacterium]
MEVQTELDFFLSSQDFEPAYLSLYRTGELQRRADEAIESLASCRGCPRKCGDDRLADKTGVCKTGRFALVSNYVAHNGEENCLSGWHGSGTIFFSRCNLRCLFCQNYEISHLGHGEKTCPQRLAEMMLELQRAGCHNINLVSPSHVVPQILEALVTAVEGGLKLPLVYNTSAYDSMANLHHMDGVVDIYMPDFKIWDSRLALKYLSARNYPQAARRAIKEMHRQVGELKIDEHGLAKRGVLVRHLVMPGGIAGTRAITRFLAREISPHTYINIMSQYFPAGKVSDQKLPEINRSITQREYADAIAAAQKVGLYRFDKN